MRDKSFRLNYSVTFDVTRVHEDAVHSPVPRLNTELTHSHTSAPPPRRLASSALLSPEGGVRASAHAEKKTTCNRAFHHSSRF